MYTPGPWERNGRHIFKNGEQEANAKLAAAAPELLEALQAFLRAPHTGSDGPGSSTIVVQDFNIRAARAAIAKATGKEGV